ncbi:MAG: M3 family metallopeptidase, partial [Dokdonella sp.]
MPRLSQFAVVSALIMSAGFLSGCNGPGTETAQAPAAAPAPAPAAAVPEPVNPFFIASTLPFEAPPFDKIKDSDYQPAIEEGMKRHLAEVHSIVESSDAATFSNTIVPMERAGSLLSRVMRVFGSITQANTNETLQKIQSEEAPKLAAHSDAIYLDPKLFARVKLIYDQRASSDLDPVQIHLVERYYRDFLRAGAELADADKESLKVLNQEESTLQTDFQTKLLAATVAGGVVVDDKTQLDGMSEGDIAAAAEAAKGRKLDGKWLIALQNTTQQPALASLKNRDLRTRLLKASMERAEHGDGNDTRALIQRLAELRAQKAKLLGYPTYAAYSLDDQMAKTPAAAEKLMTDMVPAATAKATGEVKKMQALIDKQKGGFKLTASDWDFYAEQVRKAEYDLDEDQIKPYFELNRVLHDGVFFAANQMYGLTF